MAKLTAENGAWSGIIMRSALVGCVGVSLLWFALYAVALVPAIAALGDASEGKKRLVQLYAEGAGLGTVLLAAYVFFRFVYKKPLTCIGFQSRGRLRQTVTGVLVGAVLVFIAVLLLAAAGAIRVVPTTNLPVVMFAVIAASTVMNAILQEVWVRGLLQHIIAERWGDLLAMLLSSLVFVAIHAGALNSPIATVNVFFASLLFGLAYAKTLRLWLPIGLHIGWNVMLGPVLGLTISGRSGEAVWQPFELVGSTLLTGGSFGLEGGLAATVAVLVGIGFVLRVFRGEEHHQKAF